MNLFEIPNRQVKPGCISRQWRAAVILVACCWGVGEAGLAEAQWPPGWAAPPVMVTGATLGDKLRNASNAASAQADSVRRTARDWQNRVSYMGYQGAYYQQDYANLYFQFQNLRSQLGVMSSLAAQAGSASASNSAAELENGLNIISELFTMLQNQSAAGTLDRATVARVCRALDQALGEWQRELKKDSSRFGVIW